MRYIPTVALLSAASAFASVPFAAVSFAAVSLPQDNAGSRDQSETRSLDQDSGPGDTPLLAGPEVDAGAAPASLIERGVDGSLKRLEARPEIIAIELLELDEASQQRVDAVLLARATQIDAFLRDHAALYNKLLGAAQARTRPDRADMREFRRVAAPLLTPTLFDRLAESIPDDQSAELRRLVEEYNQALRAEYAGEAMESPQRRARGPMADRAGDGSRQRARRGGRMERLIADRQELLATQSEIGRALRTRVQIAQERTEELVAMLSPDMEQEAEIRRIIRTANEQAMSNGGERTSAAALIAELYQVLSPEQRRTLRAHFAGNRPRGAMQNR